jgi:hypothetical protein
LRWVFAVLVLCACSDGGGGTATLRIRIDRDPASATPAYVTLSAYAGRADSNFHNRRIDGMLPSDTVVTPLHDFTPWRLFAWGFVSGQNTPVSFATVEVTPAASGETLARLVLGNNVPTDSDGDGVPDNYDDCPQTPDPEQLGNCNGTQNQPDASGNNIDASPMTGPNLIMNPGCETDTSGWGGYHSTITQAPLPRSGSFSCMVCLNANFTNYTIDDNPNTVSMPLAGQLYVASAWVKSGPSNVNTMSISLTLREHTTQGVIGPQTQGQPVTLTDQWQQVTSAHMLAADAFDLDIYIGGNGTPGDCFLVDDVYLARIL